ncbi:hypothetical protein [Streptomyces sp. NRRL S-146]|uniref:hypothetical protein n=1 Tax=Streptomyces sp. NRRL S-146 TaxID=1463884 RepID=UPI0004C75761|nr:hypothetical protein [Streptomyces sp. NRRL S-146]
MTPGQVFTVAAIGGLAVVLGLVLVVLLALAIYAAVARIIDLHDALRERRAHARERAADLATLHAIDALGTTSHPKEK